MSRFSKHLGDPEPIEIEGEQYVLKPLTTEYIPDFFKAMKAFSGAGEGGDVKDALSEINEEGLMAVRRLIEATLKISFPDDWKNDQHEVKQFGLKYMHLLIGKIFEINSATVESKDVGAIKKAETLKRLKQKQKKDEQGQA